MRCSLIIALGCIVSSGFASQSSTFERFFTERTMRVDYFHTGTKGQETISLDGVREEGPWPGSRTNLLDTLNLGEFIVRVYDRDSNLLIFSKGFSSLFNEWQTTDEALNGMYRTFSESVRFPFPKRAVQLTIARRDKQMVFHELFTTIIDPGQSVQVNRRKNSLPWKVEAVMENGPSADKVDIVILGDGYTKGEMEKFRKDARHFNDVMFGTHPFRERKKDFNVWMVDVESRESGIDVPDMNVWKEHALGTRYNTFGSARYVLTTDNTTVRDAAALAPYDCIIILVNDTRYGGGGIFNLYSTVYAREAVAGQEWRSDYVYVHEFGHSFAGLGDEYYTSSTAYNDFYPAGVEPWEPNITALTGGRELKWKALVSPGVEIPTPWEKAEYDSLQALYSRLDRLAPDYYQKSKPLYDASMRVLKTSRAAGKVGAFEGAGYATRGLYRPAVDCRMFSLSLADFDPVCSAAIERMIDFYSH